MKSTTSAWILALMFCAILTSSFQLVAQSPAGQTPTSTYRYRAVDMGTPLGGSKSTGCVPDCRYVNNQGTVVFNTNTPVSNQSFGVEWQNGRFTTLNPLPGGSYEFPYWTSDTNLVAGYSYNGALDPATGSPEIRAVLWDGGIPANLGTFGGSASLAWGVNDSGQVVGGAANTTPDALAGDFYNVDPFPYQVSTEIHAFLWDRGELHDLQTLGGPDSVAQYVNESGQVAGISFTNSTPNATTGLSTLDPFLWGYGQMKDLHSLGGTMGFVSGLNNQGHVIGTSNLAGDATSHPFVWQENRLIDLQTLGGDNGSAIWISDAGAVAGWADLSGSEVHHAFIWTNGEMKDLGTIGTDPCSTAYGMNARGQVVGNSGDGSGIESCGPKIHGFLWENGGPMVDLDTLFAPLANGLQYFGACCINNSGEILGSGKLPNGDIHALVLIPCDANHEDAPACHASPTDVEIAAAPRTTPQAAPGAAASGIINRNPHKPHSW